MRQFIPVFLMILLSQSLMSVVQVVRYQREIKAVKGSGRILGVGARKNGLKAGSLFLVALNKETLMVEECRKMKGATVFCSFKEEPQYVGLSLNQLRALGMEEDARINGKYRKKHPYDPDAADKKKGTVIQAVEILERQICRLRRENVDVN